MKLKRKKQPKKEVGTLVVTLKADTRAFEKKLTALEKRVARLRKAAAG